MSNEALTWAFKKEIKPSSLKFVLVAMCDYANDQGEAYPSIQTLTQRTCQNRKTVLSNIKKLVEMGHLVDSGQRKGRTNQVIVYRVNSSEIGTVERVPKTDSKKPKNGTVKQAQKRDTEPSVSSNHQGSLSTLRFDEPTPLNPEWLKQTCIESAYVQILGESDILPNGRIWNEAVGSFIDYWTSADTKNPNKKDWLATWRRWLREDVKKNGFRWRMDQRNNSPAEQKIPERGAELIQFAKANNVKDPQPGRGEEWPAFRVRVQRAISNQGMTA